MIEVYYAPPSIYGRKVLTVLKEKDLDFEIRKMSFSTQDHLKEDYLKINPNGEIPAIVDDGQIIYESTAIIEYLDEEYPEPPLMPVTSYERARVRFIEDFHDLHLYPAVVKCFIKVHFENLPLEEEDKQNVVKGLDRIETYLGNQEFLAGKFSLADCAFMPALATVIGLKLTALLDTRSKGFKSYCERLKKRPGFAGASLMSFEKQAVNT